MTKKDLTEWAELYLKTHNAESSIGRNGWFDNVSADQLTEFFIDMLSKLKEQLPEERGDELHELSQYGRGNREGHNDLLSQVTELLTVKEE